MLFRRQQLPLPKLNPVKQMEAVPSLFRNKRTIRFTHGRCQCRKGAELGQADASERTESVERVAALGRGGRQYSSPSRETRNSRFGSLCSVAPQVAQRWSGSASLCAVCTSKRRRLAATSRRCRN